MDIKSKITIQKNINQIIKMLNHELWYLSVEEDYAIAYIYDNEGGGYTVEKNDIYEIYNELLKKYFLKK
jgi:hypothetical protein